jgi:hypothetical protein
MYGESQFADYMKMTGHKNRAEFEKTLGASYAEEGGSGAQVTVKRLDLKDKSDLDDFFKGTSYDVVVYDGHGSSKAKQILPGGKVVVTPEDLQSALAGAKTAPKKMFLYGCNTAKSGFARSLSELLPNTAITGTGNRIAPYYGWEGTRGGGKTNIHIDEDRTHNITFERGRETRDVRKIDMKELENAGIR